MNNTTLNIERKKTPKAWLHIKGTSEKPGTKMMYVFLFGSWLFVALWLVASILLFHYNWGWACLMLFSTVAFAWYLKQVDKRLDSLRSTAFELTFDAEKISLDAYDFKAKRGIHKKLFWNEIRWAEVYRYVDEPTVVLQGWDSSVDIPLWAFGPRKQAIMDALMTKKIPIVRLP